MAITNKAAIQALIDAYTANITLYITSNNNKEITGAQLKQILDESSVILEDLKDSYFNLLDEPRTALSVSFAALNALDWDVLPTEVKSALDGLASRVKVLELSPSLVRQIPFYVNTSSTTSNIVATYGTVALFGAERKTSKLVSVAYETSVDGGDTWTSRADFGALQTFMNSAISTSFIYIRAVAPVFLGGFEGEQEFILEYN